MKQLQAEKHRSPEWLCRRGTESCFYIRIGSLSIELEELRSSVVAAQLGEEAISTSVMAGVIGLAS